ncbi:MAG: ribosomal protein S18-alanine N-acetyltransferase [Endomicrobia bacterium]|nr:ribosomal protein S18-alanine N-acetyltransferase [Endomicrobiia bacterium]
MLVIKNLEITEAQLTDIEDIYNIEIENFKFPWSRHFFIFNLQLPNELSKFYIAKIENEVIGYIICWISGETAHIHNLSVKKSYQNLGVGSALLDFLLHKLRSGGITTVTLEVGVNNSSAIKFYKKFGFNIVLTKSKFYNDEDAFLMMKEL